MPSQNSTLAWTGPSGALKLGHRVCTRPLHCDDGREVHLVQVCTHGGSGCLAALLGVHTDA